MKLKLKKSAEGQLMFASKMKKIFQVKLERRDM